MCKELSGGQKQRVVNLLALILNFRLFWLMNLVSFDSKNAQNLMLKLSNMNKEIETTILMVTHDCVSASYCNRILFIQDGKIFSMRLEEIFQYENQEAFYQRILKVMSQLSGGELNVF